MLFEACALSFTVWRRLGIVMVIFVPPSLAEGTPLMAAVPLLEEISGGPSGTLIAGLAGLAGSHRRSAPRSNCWPTSRPRRQLAIYPASAGFDLVEELDYLCARTIEPNVFFNPRFLAPAMPRLEDREVRLAVIRDGDEYRSRLRLLVPFSVERPAVPLGVPIMRTWSSPFGPLGTPLVDRDDPAGRDRGFLRHAVAAASEAAEGARAARHAARRRRRDACWPASPRRAACRSSRPAAAERPFLESDLDGDAYLQGVAALAPSTANSAA